MITNIDHQNKSLAVAVDVKIPIDIIMTLKRVLLPLIIASVVLFVIVQFVDIVTFDLKEIYNKRKEFLESAMLSTSPSYDVTLPEGLQLLFPENISINKSQRPDEAEHNWYRFISSVELNCTNQQRLGKIEDGGWSICIVNHFKPGKPCTVYSFGINNEWSFDDAISRMYNCSVKAFDPSMPQPDHRHSALVWFYKRGLAGTNRVNEEHWQLGTLATFLVQLKDYYNVIDYLKMDIDYHEWESFRTLLLDGSLSRVKQFAFEIHTSEVLHRETSVEKFVEYWETLKLLERLNFKRWYSNVNPWGFYDSARTTLRRSCCYELVYLNMNFLRGVPSMPPMPTAVPSVKAVEEVPHLAALFHKASIHPAHLQPASSQAKLPQPTILRGEHAELANSQLAPLQLEGPQLKYHPGYRFIKSTARQLVDVTDNMSPREAEEYFYGYIVGIDVVCPSINLVAAASEKVDWKICASFPFDLEPSECRACVVGYDDHRNFGKAVSAAFQCNVLYISSRSETEIGHQRTNLNLDTFRTHLRDLHNKKRNIDICQMDLNSAEMDGFKSLLSEDSFTLIKQLYLTIELVPMNVTSQKIREQTTADFVANYNLLKTLKDIGFYRYHFTTHSISTGSAHRCEHFLSKYSEKARPSCVQFQFVNTKFFTEH